MRPLPSKCRRPLVTLWAIGLGLLAVHAGEAAAANLTVERLFTPELGDGTPFEEPEVNPDVPHDPGGIGGDESKPEEPEIRVPYGLVPRLAPLHRILQWVVVNHWIG
jgi:hypothetical protein